MDVSRYRTKFPPREHEEAVRMLLQGLDKEEIESNISSARRATGPQNQSSSQDSTQRQRRGPSQDRSYEAPSRANVVLESTGRQQQVVQSGSSSVDSADPLASCSGDSEHEAEEERQQQRLERASDNERGFDMDAYESPSDSIQVSPRIQSKQIHLNHRDQKRPMANEEELPLVLRMQSKATSTASESISMYGCEQSSSTNESVGDDMNGNYEAIPNRTIAVQCDLKVSSVKRSSGLDQELASDASTDLASMRVSSISSTRYGFYKLGPEMMEQRRRLARSISSRNIARSPSRAESTEEELAEVREQRRPRPQSANDSRQNLSEVDELVIDRPTKIKADCSGAVRDPNEGYDSELEVVKRRALAKKLLPQVAAPIAHGEQASEDEAPASQRMPRATGALTGPKQSRLAHNSLPRRPRTALAHVSANKLRADSTAQQEPRLTRDYQLGRLATSRDRAMSQQVLTSNNNLTPNAGYRDNANIKEDFNHSSGSDVETSERYRVPCSEEIIFARRRMTPPVYSDNENQGGSNRQPAKQFLRRSATLKADGERSSSAISMQNRLRSDTQERAARGVGPGRTASTLNHSSDRREDLRSSVSPARLTGGNNMENESIRQQFSVVGEQISGGSRRTLVGEQRVSRNGPVHSSMSLARKPLIERSCNGGDSRKFGASSSSAKRATAGALAVQPTISRTGSTALSGTRLSRQDRSTSQQVLSSGLGPHELMGTLARGQNVASELGSDADVQVRSATIRRTAPHRPVVKSSGAALNRSVSVRQGLDSQPVTMHYRKIIHTPVSVTTIRQEPGYEEEEADEERLSYASDLRSEYIQDNSRRFATESEDSESPMTRSWANPSLARARAVAPAASRLHGEELRLSSLSRKDSDHLDGRQQRGGAPRAQAHVHPLDGGRGLPQMGASLQYQSENSSEFSSSLSNHAQNEEYRTLDEQPLDYDSQQRLNEIGLPDPCQVRLASSSSSHLGVSRHLMASGADGARYATTERVSRPISGRAMSQQSLTRPTMPLSRRLRRSGEAGATVGGLSEGATSDVGGSSVSLISRLRDGSRYESAHTRTPVVMYIPQASASTANSRHSSATDLAGPRSSTMRKSMRSRSASKSRSSLGISGAGATARGRSSSRQGSDSETSSMLRTLVKPRTRSTTKSGASAKVRKRSSSRRRMAASASDDFDENDDGIGELATEIDSYKFTRRYSVPKDAKINWFARLKQRVTSLPRN